MFLKNKEKEGEPFDSSFFFFFKTHKTLNLDNKNNFQRTPKYCSMCFEKQEPNMPLLYQNSFSGLPLLAKEQSFFTRTCSMNLQAKQDGILFLCYLI